MCMIISFQSQFEFFEYVILAEHIIIMIKILLAGIIKDVPHWVIEDQHRQQECFDDVL